MKLNNKGMTIIEIIISITLVSIVLVFLFNVMITVRNEDSSSQSQSKLLINQALIIKDIETEFKDLELQGVNACNETDLTLIKPKNAAVENSNLYCLKLIYNPAKTTDAGYIFYYSYYYSYSPSAKESLNVVGYKRGDNKIMRETDAEAGTTPGKVKQTCTTTATPKNYCSIAIYMPIIGDDGDDYGINLSYIYNPALVPFAYNKTSANNFDIS